MLLLIVIGGGLVCGFGVLSVLSNERAVRLRRIENALRVESERQAAKAAEIPVVGSSPVPHAAIAEPEEQPVLVR